MSQNEFLFIENKLIQIWSRLLNVKAVTIDDNFFALGGHSLLAIDLLSEIEGHFNIRLNMKDIVERPTIKDLIPIIAIQNKALPMVEAINEFENTNIFPLSSNQKQLWNLCALYPHSLTHNISTAIKIKKKLDIEIINKVINLMIERNACLRTRFMAIRSVTYQEVLPAKEISLEFISIKEEDLETVLEEEMKFNYDLTSESLLRVKFFKLSEHEYVFFFMVHHIVWDGISNTLFFHEFLSLYDCLEKGLPVVAPVGNVSFKDHVLREMRYQQSGEFVEEKLAWAEYLKGDLPVLNLPVDYERTNIINNESDTLMFDIDKELLEKLESYVQNKHISLYNLFLSAYYFLLFSQTKDEEFIVGTPVHGRNTRDLRKVFGYFINSLPIRTKLNGEKSFKENIGFVINSLSHAFYNQNVPLETLLKNSSVISHPGRNPLFQSLFIYLDVTKEIDIFEEHKLELIKNKRKSVHTEIDFYMYKSRFKVECAIEFRRDLYHLKSIQNMSEELIKILNAILNDENELLDSLRTPADIKLDEQCFLNLSPYKEYDDQRTLLDLFSEQVKNNPEKVAVAGLSFSSTYQELDLKSNQVANYIKTRSLGKGDYIGVCLKRNEDLVVGLLGILKSGAAYVPLDPAFPFERLKYMAEKVEAKLILTFEKRIHDNGTLKNCVDIKKILAEAVSTPVINTNVNRKDSCYVLFTSGSTGRPKGVEVTHHNVINFLESMSKSPGMKKSDNLLCVTTISFDISVLEIFLPLITGASLYLANNEEMICGDTLKKIISDKNITIMQATPVTWRIILARGEYIYKELKVLCGGEALQRDLAMKLLSSFKEVWNMYGPTETTVWSLIKKISINDKKILVGNPIDNTSVYILDENSKLQKNGMPGRLFIAGHGVTRGYIKDQIQTDEKFMVNPFRENDLMYDTGDMARYDSHGEIECLGRADDQVKVRGYRIELGEIEDTILENNLIAECCVKTIKDDLIAFVTLKKIDDLKLFKIEEIKDKAKLKLPLYMIPSKIWVLESMPKTLNGKVDKKQLTAELAINKHMVIENVSKNVSSNFINIQYVVEDIWKSVLGVDHVSKQENFFNLGGHSLLAVEMFGRINEIFNLNLSLSVIFESNSIESISALIEKTMIENKKELTNLKTIVQIKSNDQDERPIFCFHGIGGNVLNYYRLSECVGQRPFYGVQSLGINGEDNMLGTIPLMADYYIKEMKKVQPKGPYLLAGGSMGGMIALEVAGQLKLNGDDVSNIIMFDTIGPDLDIKTYGKVDFNFYERLSDSLLRKYDKTLIFLKSNYYKLKKVPVPHSLRYKVVENKNYAALLNYNAQVYEGDITLIRAPQSAKGHYADPYLGWRRLINGKIETIEIDGNHEKFIEAPEFAQTFKKVVNKF